MKSISEGLFNKEVSGVKIIRSAESIGVGQWNAARLDQVSWDSSDSRENAVLVMLVRNEELHGARFAMRQVEDRFNKRFGYPWVFLNDQLFTDEFVQLTSALATGETNYGVIPKRHWSFPKFINRKKAEDCMKTMAEKRRIVRW